MDNLTRPSCEYYAFTTLPYALFQRVNQIYSLFHAITSIPHEVSEPSIAHQKCMFYLNDIRNLAEKKAIHPLCIALENTTVKPWQDIITATQMEIDQFSLSNEEDFKRYAHKKYGSLYQLIAEAIHVDLPLHNELGYFVAQIKRLQSRTEENQDKLTLATQSMIPTQKLSKPFNILYRLYEDILKLMQKTSAQNDTSPFHKLLRSRFVLFIG